MFGDVVCIALMAVFLVGDIWFVPRWSRRLNDQLQERHNDGPECDP